jgi:serine/threonine-protein kinase
MAVRASNHVLRTVAGTTIMSRGSRVIGSTIGNYEVQRLIGEGGMGKVYLAFHPGIGRQAAVKVLASNDAADPQIVSRFFTEARAANAIRHPNIVDIYDSGVIEGGAPYIIMEFLDGETLAQALARGPLPLEDALDWGCQIAEALAAAHAHEVVHRDLKPDNLFLVHDARRLGKKQVKVLDFGIAKLQRTTWGQVHKTRTGALLGTPLYMSPEQCMSTKDIDPRSDIYSLGVILYEMVTGKRPFDGDSVYLVINMHVNEKPVAPSTYRPDLPPLVEEIILRALAKTPTERQSSMAEVLSQLEMARGNPTASSDALARLQQEPWRPVPLPVSQQVAVPEIKTLGDTAVSKKTTGQTSAGRSSTRFGLPLLVALGAALIVVYVFSPFREPHTKAPVIQSTISLPRPAVPTPLPPPTKPKPIELGLESVPAGATVYIGDVLIGATPTTYEAASAAESLEFIFRLEGFQPERIRALPTPGLKITANFPTPPPEKRPAGQKRKRSPNRQSAPSTDIQFER